MYRNFSYSILAAAATAILAIWVGVLDRGILVHAQQGKGHSDADYSRADASPLPGYKGNYVSVGGTGEFHKPAEPSVMSFVKRDDPNTPPKPDCSPGAIIYYAKKAPGNFQPDKKGKLYGVRTHTNATAVDTPIGRFDGFNSCALVASAIMRKAGCRWMKITANAKAVYDMAYSNGWRPTPQQTGGCIVAWNARWEGDRPRIGRGDHSNTMPKNRVMFRHIGVTTDTDISVDNSGIMSEPSESSTYRPIRYEPPIYLCPNFKSAKQKKR